MPMLAHLLFLECFLYNGSYFATVSVFLKKPFFQQSRKKILVYQFVYYQEFSLVGFE